MGTQLLADSEPFFVKFWGTRGSIACPDKQYQRYGGNTSCLEVRCGARLLVFDAGTGIRSLGDHINSLDGDADDCSGDLFLTHTHLDHIVGLPFFGPLFKPKNRFRIWAGHLAPTLSLHDVLCKFMARPLFPVPPAIFSANVSFHDFTAGETLLPAPDITLRTAALNHPDRATGYRIEFGGRSICYVTDTEHDEAALDQNILGLIEEADVLIYDSTYTDEEFPRFKHWGHSTWQEGVRLCDQASVKQLVIFHHDPGHDDNFMKQVAEAADKLRPGTLVAREGLVLAP